MCLGLVFSLIFICDNSFILMSFTFPVGSYLQSSTGFFQWSMWVTCKKYEEWHSDYLWGRTRESPGQNSATSPEERWAATSFPHPLQTHPYAVWVNLCESAWELPSLSLRRWCCSSMTPGELWKLWHWRWLDIF